jgi:class 3 adenylate cyclase
MPPSDQASGEVFGHAPNTAEQVHSAAGPGSILITATVKRQTAGLFVAEDRRQHELKGVSMPMTLYPRRPGERRRSAQAAIRDAGQPCSRAGSTRIA